MSREAQILLLTASDDSPDSALEALLEGEVDWANLVLLARIERAAPVVWRRVGRLCRSGLPPGAAQLRQIAMMAEFNQMRLQHRLAASVAALADGGIEAVLLKGAALCSTVYPSFAHRPMSDLDLLVSVDRTDEARRRLLGAGWTWSVDELPDEAYQGHHHIPPLDDSSGTGASIELHTSIFIEGHPFRFPLEQVRERLVRVSVGGRTAYVLAPSDQLLHTCLHFAWSHGMEDGAWRTFRDIGAMAARGNVDWDAFVRLAVESGGGTCCYWALRLARSLAGIAVPPDVEAALRPPRTAFALARLEQHFALNLFRTELLCPSVLLRRQAWAMGILPEWSGHGAVRPWAFLKMRLDHDAALARRSRTRKLLDHLRNAPGWSRYVRSMLQPSFTADRVL